LERGSQRETAWRDFLAWTERFTSGRWVFRGLGDDAYDLLPTVGRSKSYSSTSELAVLDIFRRRVTEFLSSTEPLNDSDALGLAQHHGAPTRLMDWTSNPLVAAFFAVNAKGRGGNPVLIAKSLGSDEIIQTDVDIDPFSCATGFVLPRFFTYRISSQSGLFSVHSDPTEPILDHREPARADMRFIIPVSQRNYFQERLFYFGFDAQRIMGDLDGIGTRLHWQYDRAVGLDVVR